MLQRGKDLTLRGYYVCGNAEVEGQHADYGNDKDGPEHHTTFSFIVRPDPDASPESFPKGPASIEGYRIVKIGGAASVALRFDLPVF